MPNSQIFKHQDISHKPKRLQADNIAKATGKKIDNNFVEEYNIVSTPESAVKYFTELSKTSSSNAQLYKMTAYWLKDYITIRNRFKEQKPKEPEVVE